MLSHYNTFVVFEFNAGKSELSDTVYYQNINKINYV
jgi:hypothetical protein